MADRKHSRRAASIRGVMSLGDGMLMAMAKKLSRSRLGGCEADEGRGRGSVVGGAMKIPNNDLKANLSARRYGLSLYRKTHGFFSDGWAVEMRIMNCEGMLVSFF